MSFWEQTHKFDFEKSLRFQNIVGAYFAEICGMGEEYDSNWNTVFTHYDGKMFELVDDIMSNSKTTNEDRLYLKLLLKIKNNF